MKQTLSLLAAALLAAATARAASITYQGALRNVSGQALTGNQTIEFRLYEQATGGTALWGRACSVLLDANGLFNTELGDDTGSALSGVSTSKTLARIVSENADKPLYVGVTVADTSGEIAPRQRILSVPYALYADDVTSASGDFAAAGRVTATALTVSGEAFLGYAERIRDIYLEMNHLFGKEGLPTRPVFIRATDFVASRYLPQRLEKIRAVTGVDFVVTACPEGDVARFREDLQGADLLLSASLEEDGSLRIEKTVSGNFSRTPICAILMDFLQ